MNIWQFKTFDLMIFQVLSVIFSEATNFYEFILSFNFALTKLVVSNSTFFVRMNSFLVC